MTQQYDADYFLRGKELGISGYTDYRWLPELTMPMVASMVRHLGIQPDDTILDFGCARGYVVRAFREMGYEAFGYDASTWALDNADPVTAPYLYREESSIIGSDFAWVIAKDVLEHIDAANKTVN